MGDEGNSPYIMYVRRDRMSTVNKTEHVVYLDPRASKAVKYGPKAEWERWYTSLGFQLDKETNLLQRDGKLWAISYDFQSIAIIYDRD